MTLVYYKTDGIRAVLCLTTEMESGLFFVCFFFGGGGFEFSKLKAMHHNISFSGSRQGILCHIPSFRLFNPQLMAKGI
jgi:hypothetical protein